MTTPTGSSTKPVLLAPQPEEHQVRLASHPACHEAPLAQASIPRRAVFLTTFLFHAGAVFALIDGKTAAPAPPAEMVMQVGWLPAPVAAAPKNSAAPRKTARQSQPAPPRKLPASTPRMEQAPSTSNSANTAPAAATASSEAGTPHEASAEHTPSGKTETPTPPSFAADYLANPAPEYPRLSRELGEEGRVELRVHVTTKGLPDDITPHRSSGHERLDRAALQAVWRWKFVPARLGQEALAGWVIVPISFNLRK